MNDLKQRVLCATKCSHRRIHQTSVDLKVFKISGEKTAIYGRSMHIYLAQTLITQRAHIAGMALLHLKAHSKPALECKRMPFFVRSGKTLFSHMAAQNPKHVFEFSHHFFSWNKVCGWSPHHTVISLNISLLHTFHLHDSEWDYPRHTMRWGEGNSVRQVLALSISHSLCVCHY